ncbi:MAG TPA: redox-sensitive transcriptional activator SoxR [Candidatus Baltobacteraceae bacterium]|nr:redox-sensitive transcriptional activator SoxR [Candidatus Baltobacteraceae bacterium]
MAELLTIGEVAQRSGVAVSTLHFYEAKGLIHSVRSSGNQRRYERSELRRIAVIRVAQRAGISLREIRETLATLPSRGGISAKDWAALSKRWKGDLNNRIARLEALRDQLGDCIGCGCLSLSTCPLRNPSDIAGEDGAGPRYIDPQ